MTDIDHAAYLDAKRGLDDRSLNRDVLRAFAEALPPEPTVLEVGAGTGTMVQRLHEWGVIDDGRWIAVDTHEGAIRAGRRRLASHPDGRADEGAADDEQSIRLGDLAVDLRVADAFEYAESTGRRFDAVVGCAFFDVVDAEPAVGRLGAVAPLAYAPITYDGETTLSPADPEDDAVLDAYHRHMREYRPGGPEGAAALARAAESVVADGPSPWTIEPPYTTDDETVLGHILDTIETAVGETGYDAGDWASRRRAALAAGDLTYRARNRDLLVRL